MPGGAAIDRCLADRAIFADRAIDNNVRRRLARSSSTKAVTS
jgi:hypothetical protein